MEEEAEVPKPKETKLKFWNDSNTLLSFSAIFISAVTLFILIYQTSLASKQFDLEQKQQLASVMPYLQVGIGNWDEDGFTIYAENNGIGPAFIKKVCMHYQDSVYENTDYQQLLYILRDKGEYGDYLDVFSNLLKGSVIPANRKIEHIKIVKGDRPNAWGDLLQSDEVELEIEYASIYDERWVVRGKNNEPIKTRSITD